MYTIYLIQNKINLKIYIGQTNNIKRRWSRHKYEAFTKNNQKPLYRSIRKYGLENFSLIELEHHPLIDIDEAEKFWIENFQSNKKLYGYNLSIGGKPLKDHTIIKTRKSSMLGKTHSAESKMKMRKSHMGEQNHFYGKTHSDESKLKMSNNENRKYLGDKNYFYHHKYQGSNSKAAKLNETIILEIRSTFNDHNTSFEELAKKYEVSPSTISRIIKRKTWTHI